MQKILLAPDSFKGTMTAAEICMIMAEEIRRVFPACEIVEIPVADGGEGTVESFLRAVPGQAISARISGPFGEPVDGYYALLDSGKTAVVEMAAAAGLPMVEDRKDPAKATTYGVGQLIAAAVQRGARQVIVGMGGSCTNDGGCGMAAALGVKFMDAHGREFIPTGGTLESIVAIDTSGAEDMLRGVTLRAMCDVDNPLCGPEGAAFVFAPQKGADAQMVQLLDQGLCHYGRLLEMLPGNASIASMPGAGAAGGLGAGMRGLLGAELVPGIEAVLDVAGFDALIDGCDLIFTGEGRIDGQSLSGKVVLGVARRAARKGTPVCAIVGDAQDEGLEAAYEQGLTSVISINRLAIPFAQAKPRAKDDLRATVRNLLRLLATQTR